MPEADQKFLALLPALGAYRSLLCLKGILPGRTFFSHFNLPIIAADGAYNLLLEKGIVADVAIGDCDSIRAPIAPQTRKIVAENQDFSDFQKALKFVRENRLSPPIILGINGGYIDHILSNVAIFSRTDAVAYMPPNVAMVVRDRLALRLPLATKLSLFAVPFGRVTTRGLRWELENRELHFPEYNSCFNRTVAEQVAFEVAEGAIFLVIYLENIADAGSEGIELIH
ncbi:MAG: thiamine diphosphokinase [Puniceicoccales bacterium]|jgi:thiamine pyrophosphokinase|nr:thiamine diphosphokinase [Puniceicoccales bacterium]